MKHQIAKSKIVMAEHCWHDTWTRGAICNELVYAKAQITRRRMKQTYARPKPCKCCIEATLGPRSEQCLQLFQSLRLKTGRVKSAELLSKLTHSAVAKPICRSRVSLPERLEPSHNAARIGFALRSAKGANRLTRYL